MSSQQAAEAQAKATRDEMLRIYASRDEENKRLLLALQNAQATLAQSDAYHLANLAQAYATANTYATAQANAYATGVQHARQAHATPRSHPTSNAGSVRHYDLSPERMGA